MTQDDRGGSIPCMAHMLVNGQLVDPDTLRDVARFRRGERVRLLDARRHVSTSERAVMTQTLSRALDTLIAPQKGMKIAVYWPIRGEPDLRDWMARVQAAGATVLLPVVLEKNAPLVFRPWFPGCTMVRGIWNIPIPANGPDLIPDVVVTPLLGVDDACFRLGNGGGYYDRTLAQFDPLPRVVGVGFADCRIPTIFPMPWDIPMEDVILTDGSVQHRL